jgi:hypothetical protein
MAELVGWRARLHYYNGIILKVEIENKKIGQLNRAASSSDNKPMTT